MKFAPLAALGLAVAALTTPAFADDSVPTTAPAPAAAFSIDTPIEVAYYQHGGILPFVLRQLLAA